MLDSNIVFCRPMSRRQALRQTVLLASLAALSGGLPGCAHRPAASSFTFVQMCDPQLGFGGYEEDVARLQQSVRQINQLHPDFVVICGDLVNAAGEKSFADFNAIKGQLKMPCYCAPGNHDISNSPTPQTLARYRNAIGKDYYSFTHKGCAFVVLNSQLMKVSLPGESERQDAWLKQTLSATAKRQQPIFVIDHYPLFEKSADEPEEYFNLAPAKRQELLGLFRQNGVVALLSGHTHKTILNQLDGIQLVASQTTSKNFDKQPFGFRVWHVGPQRPYQNDFVPLAGTLQLKTTDEHR